MLQNVQKSLKTVATTTSFIKEKAINLLDIHAKIMGFWKFLADKLIGLSCGVVTL
jgi:hypothetical protein